MKKLISATEAGDFLGIDRSRIKQLCREKRMEGAYKIGNQWVIPFPPKILPKAKITA